MFTYSVFHFDKRTFSCDELTQKYGLIVSSKSRDLLLRRKKLFLTSGIASKQKIPLAQGQYGKAAALFLKHPYLLIFTLLRLRNRLYNNQVALKILASITNPD